MNAAAFMQTRLCHRMLVFDREISGVQAQLVQTLSERQTVTSRDNHRLHARRLQHFQAMSIQGVKAFEYFALTAHKQAAVSQHTVYIQQQQFHAAPTGQQ
jgi:hypothetical protein